MSMLLEQCNSLRAVANRLDEIGISIGHNTTTSAFIAHDISVHMREAANTIEYLRDRLQKSYDAGFSNGVKACLQQLDGLVADGADVDEIRGWIDRQWEEEA